MAGTVRSGRRKIIEKYLDVKSSSILEIGALDYPTYKNNEIYVKYMDYASSEDIAKKDLKNPRYKLENIVNVDYVCPHQDYSKHIDEKFELVIANHVIEHIPNIITWLGEIHKILKTDGLLFLSIPDKRYTFDISRKETIASDVLRNYFEELKKPSFYHIFDHFYYHKKVSAKDVWLGNYENKLKINRFSPKDALNLAKKMSKEHYADVHCSVFTNESFIQLYDLLFDLEMVDFALLETGDVEYMSNEFHVMLRKLIR